MQGERGLYYRRKSTIDWNSPPRAVAAAFTSPAAIPAMTDPEPPHTAMSAAFTSPAAMSAIDRPTTPEQPIWDLNASTTGNPFSGTIITWKLYREGFRGSEGKEHGKVSNNSDHYSAGHTKQPGLSRQGISWMECPNANARGCATRALSDTILYSTTSAEFDEFRVDTHLCKLRNTPVARF